MMNGQKNIKLTILFLSV